MRALIRRVSSAKVEVERKQVSSISKGLLVFLGVQINDSDSDLDWILRKILGIRLFDDENGRMNQPISDELSIMVISQFTLLGTLRKGFRASFHRAAAPEDAKKIYDQFIFTLSSKFGGEVKSGVFGENMKIDAIDSGPVSIWIDSRNKDY